MCYLYFFCLHCCLINIHIFDYPDSRLSGLFTEVPTSPDNRGSTVPNFQPRSQGLSSPHLKGSGRKKVIFFPRSLWGGETKDPGNEVAKFSSNFRLFSSSFRLFSSFISVFN